MKKRIISLVLVIVMAAGLLVSCAYSFADDNMENYASFDAAAFKAFEDSLKALMIEDGEFSAADEAKRENMVKDAVFGVLSATGEKVEGSINDPKKAELYDVIYYCYYVTYEEDGKQVMLYTSKMTESSAASLQILNVRDEDSLEYKIQEAVKDHQFYVSTDTAPGNNYHIFTSDKKAVNGDTVCITYTKTEKDQTKGVTFTKKIVTLDENDSFLSQFIGKEPSSDKVTLNNTTEETKEYKYSDVTFHWIQYAGQEYEVKYTYDEDKNENVIYEDTGDTAEKVNVKDKELTYHIYPVYFKDTVKESIDVEKPLEEWLTWKVVIEELLGSSITSDSLDVFTAKDDDGNELKEQNGKTLAELIDGLEDATDEFKTALGTLIKTKKDAVTTYETSDESEREKLEDARAKYERALKDAQEAYEEAVEAYNKVVPDGDTVAARYKTALEAYDAAKAAYNAAKEEDKAAAETAMKDAENELTDAKNALESTDEGKKKKEEIDTAKSDMENAAAEKKVADEAASDTGVIKIYENALKAYNEAEEAYNNAEADKKTEAKTAMDNAKTALDNAATELNKTTVGKAAKSDIDTKDTYAKYEAALEAYKNAVAAYDEAIAAYNKAAADKKDAAKTAMEEAEADRDAAAKTLEATTIGKNAKAKLDAEKDLAKRMELVEHCVINNSLEEKIVKEYKEKQYDDLQDSYNKEIKVNLMKEILALVDNIKVNSLPEKAVEEVYDILMQNHKYTFYKETFEDDNETITYYYEYNGSFEKYLIATTEVGENKTMNDAEAKVWKDAEAFVTDLVRIYALSEKYDCVISDDEYEELTYNEALFVGTYYGYWGNYQARYGDIGYRAACQFAKLYNKILEIEGEQDYIDDYNDKVDAYLELSEEEQEDTEYPEFDFDYEYKENKIPFIRLEYSFKAKD